MHLKAASQKITTGRPDKVVNIADTKQGQSAEAFD